MLPLINLIFISNLFFILLISFTFSVRLFDSLYLFWGFGLDSYIYFLGMVCLYDFFGPIFGHV